VLDRCQERRRATPHGQRSPRILKAALRGPDLRPVGRQLVIAAALLAALGVLIAAMAWSTAARGEMLEKPEDVQGVERAVTELASAWRDVLRFGHSLRG